MASDPLVDLLKPQRLTAVVDIGANPIDAEPPYKPLLSKGLCTVIGFEPLPAALRKLNARKGNLETYLPYVIGDGGEATLRVCHAPGMTSLLRPDPRMLKLLGGFSELGKVVREVPVTTRRLDDIGEIGALDFLKIDVQGSELAVFRHGSRRLAEAVAVQTEVSFLPLYEQQPLFSDVDLEMRRLGFVPHAFVAVKKWMISPLTIPKKPFAAFNQLLEADVVYVRDFSQPEEMSGEQLKHLAIIAHHCYRSFDLAANCLQHLRTRSEVAQDALASYLRLLAPEATRPGRNE